MQFIWSLYQSAIKRLLHARSARIVAPAVALHGTQAQTDAHDRALRDAALRASQPALQAELTTEESFTGGVPKTVKGSKQYWREAFVQLMAMAVEYGTPQFFLTLTANEMGWVDLRRACGGRSHGSRPVEATRHYHHRWCEFKKRYLVGETPIGEITHLWYRHEEQGRGSLHVHAAVWVKEGTENPSAIRATAPRGTDPTNPTAGLTAEELTWRQFVRSVQLHECNSGCHFRHGEYVSDTFCKSGYPHNHGTVWTPDELTTADGQKRWFKLNMDTDRYEYRVECEEDLRLSPYVPEWLLAWGANMNIQCASAQVPALTLTLALALILTLTLTLTLILLPQVLYDRWLSQLHL